MVPLGRFTNGRFRFTMVPWMKRKTKVTDQHGCLVLGRATLESEWDLLWQHCSLVSCASWQDGAELVPFLHRRRLGVFYFPECRFATKNGFHLSDETQSFPSGSRLDAVMGRDESPTALQTAIEVPDY
ncbi:hypothetical protein CEXT_364711 [Caerostris extrusa]|uniref:Uncharacterized protein n=1 Tax=Caerostris extrusa TaxID=172846 RepID=A0AAV4X7T1_CAEEX|nr:hypothetical protein CEXT_364711 [Caerostris extrusa]